MDHLEVVSGNMDRLGEVSYMDHPSNMGHLEAASGIDHQVVDMDHLDEEASCQLDGEVCVDPLGPVVCGDHPDGEVGEDPLTVGVYGDHLDERV